MASASHPCCQMFVASEPVTTEPGVLTAIAAEVIVTEGVERLVSLVNGLILIPLFTLLGVGGNIVSAVVFYRQGLRERINLCLFALAIVDLVAAFSLFLPIFEKEVRTLFLVESWCLATVSPYLIGFVWASQFLSTVIASERCFCVVSPFHAKRLLKTSTTAVIIIVSCGVLAGGMCAIAGPKFTVNDIVDPVTNSIVSAFYFTRYYLDNKDILDAVDVYVYATSLSGTFLLIILVSTSITVITLRSALSQRKTMTMRADNHKSSSKVTRTMSTKELTMTRMLIGTSFLFIICYTPNFVFQVANVVLKVDHSVNGKYYNLYLVVWHVISLLRAVNTSTAVLFYFAVGSRFRQSVYTICGCLDKDSRHTSAKHGETLSVVTSFYKSTSATLHTLRDPEISCSISIEQVK